MTAPTIPPVHTPVPQRTMGQNDFDTNADAFLLSLAALPTAMNNLGEYLDELAADVVSDAATSATNAATATNRATAANNSAVAAAASATTASTAATASANSATNSANSATASANSATTAGNSATAAATSATNAANSATASANSASTASTQAGVATTRANEAAASATAAATSATSAASSATTANTQAGIATTRAGEAATSATAAATSASTAGSQASAATTRANEAAASATAAATSATSASTSANSASSSATASANSATASANSATTASNAATSATNSATSASASATTANNQAGIATTRANEAATSATAAATSANSASASATSAQESAVSASQYSTNYLQASSYGKTGNNSIANLVGISPSTEGILYYCTSYFTNEIDGNVSGYMRWRNSLPKTLHDGGRYISPTVPWNGLKGATHTAWVNRTGETNPSGNGVWERLDFTKPHVAMFGAVGDWNGTTGTDDTLSIQKAGDAVPEGGILLADSTKTYYVRNVGWNKGFTFDANMASFVVRPDSRVGGNNTPAIRFGTFDQIAVYNLQSMTGPGRSVTLQSSGEAANFAAGDLCFIFSNEFVPGWDTILGGNRSAGQGGFAETFVIDSISGGVLNFHKQIEGFYTNRALMEDVAYTSSGNLVTCTFNSHGLIAGKGFTVVSPTGALPAGNYAVESVTTNTFTFRARVDLAGSSGLFDIQAVTFQVRKVAGQVRRPCVKNIKDITEIDPGGLYSGSPQSGPHLIAFFRCIDPVAENIRARRFNLHAVHYEGCTNALAKFIEAKDGYRVSSGHDYAIGFAFSQDCTAQNIVSDNVRHTVDNSGCYDVLTENCKAFYPLSSAFSCHGTGSKRVTSRNDTVFANTANAVGWATGNPTFGADEDYTIENGVFIGTEGCAFVHSTRSKNMKIKNAKVKSTGTSSNVRYNSGAENLWVFDSILSCPNVTSPSNGNIVTNGRTASGDTAVIRVSGLFIENLEMECPSGSASTGILTNDITGDVRVKNLTARMNNGANAINIRPDTTDLDNFEIDGLTAFGNCSRVVNVQRAPKFRYNSQGVLRYGTYTNADFYEPVTVAGVFNSVNLERIKSLSARVTNGTETRLVSAGLTTTPNVNNQLSLILNEALIFDMDVCARSTTNLVAVWRVRGVIKRAGSFTTLLTPQVETLAFDSGASSWGISVEADNTLNCLAVSFTGQTGLTIDVTAAFRDIRKI